MACRDPARRGAGRFDTHRSGQVRSGSAPSPGQQLRSPRRARPSARGSRPPDHPEQAWRWGRPTSTSARRPISAGSATPPRRRVPLHWSAHERLQRFSSASRVRWIGSPIAGRSRRRATGMAWIRHMIRPVNHAGEGRRSDDGQKATVRVVRRSAHGPVLLQMRRAGRRR